MVNLSEIKVSNRKIKKKRGEGNGENKNQINGVGKHKKTAFTTQKSVSFRTMYCIKPEHQRNLNNTSMNSF